MSKFKFWVLHEMPLDMFGADAVERWFTEKEIKEVVNLTKRSQIQERL
jgi:hypothetical protein